MTNMKDYMNPWSDFANWRESDEGDEEMNQLFGRDELNDAEDSHQLDVSEEKKPIQTSQKPTR